MPETTPRLQILAAVGLSVLCLLAPLVSVYAPKVMTVFMPLAAVAALPLFRLHWPSRVQWLWLAIVAVLLATGLMLSPVPERATRYVTDGAGLVLCCLILLQMVRQVSLVYLQRIFICLGMGLTLTLVALYVEQRLHQPVATFFAHLTSSEVPPFYYIDRAIVIASLLFWAWAAATKRPFHLVFSIAVLCCFLTSQASSQSAYVGLLLGILVYTLAHVLPRLTYRLVRLGTALLNI